MGVQIEDMDSGRTGGTRKHFGEPAIDNRRPVRRPVRRGLASFFLQQWLWTAAGLRGNDENLPSLAGHSSCESDFVPTRGPSGSYRFKGRERQLQALASIPLATPKSALGISDVGNPVTISRKSQPHSRDSCQIWNELVRLVVVADELATQF